MPKIHRILYSFVLASSLVACASGSDDSISTPQAEDGIDSLNVPVAGGIRHCTCVGSVGAWTYLTPVERGTAITDIHTYCGSGTGTCLYSCGSPSGTCHTYIGPS